jgi:hypothetical protein
MNIIDVYQKATVAYNREPDDEIAHVWEGVLARWTADQVLDALRTHQADATIDDFSHRPRGSFMPTPAELIAILQQKTKAAVLGSRLSCGECEDGWIINDALPPGKRRARRCEKCAELRRQAAANGGGGVLTCVSTL